MQMLPSSGKMLLTTSHSILELDHQKALLTNPFCQQVKLSSKRNLEMLADSYRNDIPEKQWL